MTHLSRDGLLYPLAWGPRAGSCPLRFQSKRVDEQTGLYYFGRRWYDPKVQGWISRDPIREAGGVNLYAYCQNDPIARFDPIGLEEVGWEDYLIDFFWRGHLDRVRARSSQEKMMKHLLGEAFYAQRQKDMNLARLLGPSGYYTMRMIPVMDGLIPGSSEKIALQANSLALAGRQQAKEDFEINRWKLDLAMMAAGSAPGIVESIGSRLLLSGAGRSAFVPELEPLAGMPFSYQGGPGAMWIGEDLGSAAKSGIGATGKIGENALAQLGGRPQFFPTSQGARFVDRFVNGIANESKVGYQSLTPSIRLQVTKDIELMGTGKIDGAIWNFYRSPVTGKIGPSGPLGDFLNQNNIPFVLHY